MKTKIALFPFSIIYLAFQIQAFAQFTAEELAERVKWEEFLKTARIVDQEQLKGVESVTEPWKLTLQKDGIINRALWKNPKTRIQSQAEDWNWEIAAYRLDKYLGLSMVPPTVERTFKNERGSCQLWVDARMTLVPVTERKVWPPLLKENNFFRALYLERAFDNLIANEDRHQRNFLITEDWRMVLIDHSRTFRTSNDFAKKLLYDENCKDGPMLMKELPRAFVEKLKTLSPRVVREVVGEYLTEKEIKCVLIRRDLILLWLDKRIRELGEGRVLY